MHLPTELPKPGFLSSPGAAQQLKATGVTPKWKCPGPELRGLWNHPTTAPLALANQMLFYSVMQISLRSPASQEPGLPPPSVLFHPSHTARLSAASLTTRTQPIFPYQWQKKKKENKRKKEKEKEMVPWSHWWEASGRALTRSEVGSSLSGCTRHFHNYHMEQAGGAEQPCQPSLALGKQRKSSVEQTTFEYLRPTHSRMGLHFLFSKRLVRLVPSLLIRP